MDRDSAPRDDNEHGIGNGNCPDGHKDDGGLAIGDSDSGRGSV